MADSPVVVTEAGDNTPAVGQLFKDINFFLSLRLPTRSRFVADVEANGGRVVKLEKFADFVIADHMRKPTPAGSFSYTLIEQAVRDGVFPNAADHALGSALDSPRAAGSGAPGRRTRTAFTAEDDRTLWQWVEKEKAQGHLIKGNDIYKRLELANPRHTWQAWRDRYVKKLIDNPPFGESVTADALSNQASTPESEEEILPAISQTRTPSKKRSKRPVLEGVDQEDLDMLWAQAKDIDNMDESMYEEAWESWAQVNEKHTASAWRSIWEADVRPLFRKQQAKSKSKRRHASLSDGDNENPTPRKMKGKKRKVISADGDADNSDINERQVRRTYHKEGQALQETGAQSASPSANDDLEGPDDDLIALETWQESPRRDPRLNARVEESDVRTSDVGRAVDQQIQADINGMVTQSPAVAHEQIVTSDANRAADLQIQKEASIEHPTNGGGDNDKELDTSPDKAGYGRGFASSKKSGHALTEANLVSHQAKHEEPLKRGIDLPKDDQNKDQSEYVAFLQKVTGQPQENSQDVVPGEDFPSSPAAHGVRAVPELPLSSGQEEISAMESALDWPSSPQHKQTQSEGQDEQAETQLSHSQSSSSKAHRQGLMPNFELSSQSLNSQVNGESHLGRGEYNSMERWPAGTYQQPSRAHYSSTQEDIQMAQSDNLEDPGNINDTHIELVMPEPEGELTFTSSPDRRPRASGNKSHHRNEVVNISSDASSSSLADSQESQALPEPIRTTRHAVETQDIVNAETQAPDLSMPLPDNEHLQGKELAAQPLEGHAKKNQDIEAAQTQAPDLSMPLPPGWGSGYEAGTRTSTKKTVRQPQQKRQQKQNVVESQTMDVEKELESWLDTQHVRGFSEASAIAAMQRSSMRPDLAELILLAEKSDLGLPSDVPGIWSEQEDKILESGDSSALHRLEAKHGWDECDARMQFLAEWREA